MNKLTDHSVFTKQFREELIKDLNLSPSILCPKCNLNYVDNWNEDMCRYECEEEEDSSDSEEDEPKTGLASESDLRSSYARAKTPKKYEVVCVFDFYDTPLKEVIDEWLRKLLRMCGDDEELKNKWQEKINISLSK
jgi:hypothetical protein